MKLVVALGGNAILLRGERGTVEEQLHHVRIAAGYIAGIAASGHRIIITHGNGPQVGDILLKDECASGQLPRMPLDICGAESQGMIGYMLQQELSNEFLRRGIFSRVITLITRTLVDMDDPSGIHPEKPIGPYYNRVQAETLQKENGWNIHEEAGKGFRRVVPSPLPLMVVEHESIKALFESGFVVVCAGGGGIPVGEGRDGTYAGVEAVIDKDRSAALLAKAIGAEGLVILTDVPYAYLDYGTGSRTPIREMTVAQAQLWLDQGEFGEGSMAPKVESCIRFIRSGGRMAVISSLTNLEEAVSGNAGTRVVP